MGVSLVVAVTDDDWFEMLRSRPDLAEVNFWAPSAGDFRALQPGELFLFKLHAPRHSIVGGGVFAYASGLPCFPAIGKGSRLASTNSCLACNGQA
jgi:putative restriction endonuclease